MENSSPSCLMMFPERNCVAGKFITSPNISLINSPCTLCGTPVANVSSYYMGRAVNSSTKPLSAAPGGNAPFGGREKLCEQPQQCDPCKCGAGIECRWSADAIPEFASRDTRGEKGNAGQQAEQPERCAAAVGG